MAVSAERTAGLYVVIAGGWIVLSDALVEGGLDRAQTGKGLLFVVVTGLLLYAYVKAQVRRQAAYEKQLRANLESKTLLIQSVGHDLRQPLQAMALFATSLEALPLPPKGRDALDKLQHGIRRMGAQLEAILGLARLDLGKVAVQCKTVAVADLLDTLAEEMEPQAAAKGLRYRTGRTSSHVISDTTILLAILRSLIANAIRFTERGGVLVGVRHHGSRLRIAVYDTGIGIAAENLPLVFDELFQVDNKARNAEFGLGLGLPIAQRMANLLGHRLLVLSRPGRGSCFAVELETGTKTRTSQRMASLYREGRK